MLEFAEKHGVNTYDSYEAMLSIRKSTVIITLPPALHGDYGLQAASAGRTSLWKNQLILTPKRLTG